MKNTESLTIQMGSYKAGDILSITIYGGRCFEFKVKKTTKVGAVEKFFNKCLNRYNIFIAR